MGHTMRVVVDSDQGQGFFRHGEAGCLRELGKAKHKTSEGAAQTENDQKRRRRYIMATVRRFKKNCRLAHGSHPGTADKNFRAGGGGGG